MAVDPGVFTTTLARKLIVPGIQQGGQQRLLQFVGSVNQCQVLNGKFITNSAYA